MKINLEAIEGYADMTVEEKLATLESWEYEDNSAELERLKNANSRANSEAAEWKRKHNALLTEDEAKKAEEAEAVAALRAELETLRKDKAVSEYTAKYIAQGYDETLARETASALQSGDMEKVFANGEKHRAAMEKKIKADLMAQFPRPDGSSGSGKQAESSGVELAREIGREKAAANKAAEDVMKYYT